MKRLVPPIKKFDWEPSAYVHTPLRRIRSVAGSPHGPSHYPVFAAPLTSPHSRRKEEASIFFLYLPAELLSDSVSCNLQSWVPCDRIEIVFLIALSDTSAWRPTLALLPSVRVISTCANPHQEHESPMSTQGILQQNARMRSDNGSTINESLELKNKDLRNGDSESAGDGPDYSQSGFVWRDPKPPFKGAVEYAR
jgi:hypothetical protein